LLCLLEFKACSGLLRSSWSCMNWTRCPGQHGSYPVQEMSSPGAQRSSPMTAGNKASGVVNLSAPCHTSPACQSELKLTAVRVRGIMRNSHRKGSTKRRRHKTPSILCHIKIKNHFAKGRDGYIVYHTHSNCSAVPSLRSNSLSTSRVDTKIR
jgi:hypothetical protein